MSVDNSETNQELVEDIMALKKKHNAVILAHYYQPSEIQDIADYIGDSLAMAKIAEKLSEPVVAVCGVHFMAETTKILCPDKIVIEPDNTAGCSLADSCPADSFAEFIKVHPGHTVISYVNTTAAVKALTDIVVTSGNAMKVVESLPKDAKIIFGPDRNLGEYINEKTGRKMVLWDGACHVHERFSVEKALDLKKAYPGAPLLVHPECPGPMRVMADVVGSTAVLLKYAKESDKKEFIVSTESGILHQMRKECPEKTFIAVPPKDSSCGCNECSFMKLNTLVKLRDALRDLKPQTEVDTDIIERARRPIERMLSLS